MKATEPLVIKESRKERGLQLVVNCERVFRVFYGKDEKFNGLDYNEALREYEYWDKWIEDECRDDSNDNPLPPTSFPHR